MGWINKAVSTVWNAGNAAGSFLRPRAAKPADGDDYWYGPMGIGNHAGVKVTPDSAMKLSSVYTCVKVLAETMATVPLRMFRDLGSVAASPLPSILWTS